MAPLTRTFASFLVVGWIALPLDALADTPLAKARVVWVSGDRVYVASADSIAQEPGAVLTFVEGRTRVATAEVTEVFHAELIAARLTAGSLKKVKRLDRLQVMCGPPEVRPPSVLRVGYPAHGRKHPLIDCPRQTPDSSALQGAYELEAIDGRSFRMVRDPSYSVARSWPDTLLIRLFDDAADEEIALERGDLHVAVFWPGEASPHIRAAMGWQSGASGRWAGCFLATTEWRAAVRDPRGLSSDEQDALARLNQEMFRGDLVPWPGAPPSRLEGGTARFEVDPAVPGRESLERFLNQAMPPGAAGSDRVIRLELRHEVEGDWRSEAPSTRVFSIGCPVLSAPPHRRYVATLDPVTLVNLVVCSRAAAPR